MQDRQSYKLTNLHGWQLLTESPAAKGQRRSSCSRAVFETSTLRTSILYKYLVAAVHHNLKLVV